MSVFLLGLSFAFVMLWSSGWIVSRFAIEDLSTMTLLSARYLIMFMVLIILVSVFKHWCKIPPRLIALHLLFGVLSHAIYLLSGVGAFEMGVSASEVAFITALQPMIAAALSGPITQELTTKRQWQGLFIGLVAVLLMISESYSGGVSVIALTLPFVSVLALSLGTLLNRRLEIDQQYKRTPTVPFSLAMLIHSVGALMVLLPLSISHQKLHFEFNTQQWMVVLWLSIVVSFGAYALLLLLLRYLSCMQVASLTYLVPPATMFQAYIVFQEQVSFIDFAALIIASISVYLVLKPGATVEETSWKSKTSQSPKIQSRPSLDIEL